MKKIFICLLYCTSIFADIIELKSGKIYENVKSKINKDSVSFIFEEKQYTFNKSKVKFVKLKPVLLNTPLTDKEIKEYEEERIRIAEALQSAGEWEISASSKPSVALVHFSAGTGVKLNEVEVVTNLIRTSLVKTKLLTIVDTSSLAKECYKNQTDCSAKFKSDVKINKIITGSVTKLGKKYIINGNVMDNRSLTIDFAEKSTADSIEKVEDTSDYFAKKIAGGIMEYWDMTLTAKEVETYANVQYFWRSALLPGLGQYKYSKDKEDKKTKRKAYLFYVGTAFLVLNLFYQNEEKEKAEKEYKFAHNILLAAPLGSGLDVYAFIQDNKKFSEYENQTETTKISLVVLFGFYIYNLVDSAYLGKPFFPKKNSTPTGLSFYQSRTNWNGTKEDVYTFSYQLQF